jgi:hypothetical protein
MVQGYEFKGTGRSYGEAILDGLRQAQHPGRTLQTFHVHTHTGTMLSTGEWMHEVQVYVSWDDGE